MAKKSVLLTVVLVLFFSLAFTGCDPDVTLTPSETVIPQRGNTGTIETGKSEIAVSKSIPSGGGTVLVNKPDSPIDGLQLVVPAGAYTGTIDFEISSGPIEKQSFGDICNPLTPMITVEGAAELADEVMNITVPVTVPEGQFAMGFIYDAAAQKLSGMSTVAQDDKSITLATRHFCSFFISAVDKETLLQDIDSGFYPGIDDWQFKNRGSYLEKYGHCAGQAVTAIWYYVTRPDGKDCRLHGSYDNNGTEPATPELDYDDSLGYRFASVVQHDINWSSWENKFWKGMGTINDALTFNLFAYAMKATGEPQEIGMYNKSGGGHDIVCYRIKDGELYVADPNYPGDTVRRIVFQSNTAAFLPYSSGASFEEIEKGNSKDYEIIQFCPKNSTINWKSIAARWKEMKNGTIGAAQFPAYKLVYKDDKGNIQPLVDGFVSPWPKLVMGAQSIDGTVDIGSLLYRDGVAMPGSGQSEADLQPGNNKIGVHVVASVDKEDEQGNVYKVDKYVDFTYVNVIYSPLSIDPEEAVGETGQPLTFIAKGGNPPAGAEYMWLVDSDIMQQESASSFTVTFNEAGIYLVSVVMLDKSGKELAAAMAIAAIAQGETPPVIETGFKYLRIDSQFWGLYHYEYADGSSGDVEEDLSYYVSFYDITWSGGSFRGTSGKWTIDGKVNSDNSITFTLTYDNTQADIGGEGEVILRVTSLPYDSEKGEWYLEGPGLQQYVSLTDNYKDRVPQSHKLLKLMWNFGSGIEHWAALSVNTE